MANFVCFALDEARKTIKVVIEAKDPAKTSSLSGLPRGIDGGGPATSISRWVALMPLNHDIEIVHYH